MHHKDPLRPPTGQLALSQFTRSEIHQIAQQLFRLRGTGEASDPMPLEIAPGADSAMGANPLDGLVGPLIGPSAPQMHIDPLGMPLKIADQLHSPVHTRHVDCLVGLSSDHMTCVEDESEPGHRAWELCIHIPQLIRKIRVGQLCIDGIDPLHKGRPPLMGQREADGMGPLEGAESPSGANCQSASRSCV
jgi:hypothetical protein